MKTDEFLDWLRGLDVKVWAEGDRLRCSAPRGVLSEELRGELTTRKAEILRILDRSQPPSMSAGDEAKEIRAPVSFSQQRLWFLDQLNPGSAEYNVAGAVRLLGEVDIVALEQALTEILRRHESLRTVFAAVDGEPMQVITAPRALKVVVHDLTETAAVTRQAQAQRLVREEARRPFDLAQGPLFRAILIRIADREHILVLVTHHIVSDGWSSGVFVTEFGALYEAFVSGKPSPLPELPMQYADFARWQRQWLQGDALTRELAYWTRQLQGSPPVLELPTDRPRPPIRTFAGGIWRTQLSPELSGALNALSRSEGVTLFMTLLAAFKALLARYTGQEDILVGTPIANRTRVETEGLIGFFVNILVLRTDLSRDPTFRDLLQRVREVALGGYAHQDLPFEKLVEVLQPIRDMSRSPVIQVMFILDNFPSQTLELPGLALRGIELDTGMARADLTLQAGEDTDGLRLAFEYNSDLFEVTTIRRLADHFTTLLERVVAEPTAPLSALSLLSPDEHRRQLVDWNATNATVPTVNIHELVWRQARRTPDGIAAVSEGKRMTYGELDRRAHRLAGQLRRLGVRPGVIVGLCVERSLDMLVGLLGILEAGGAYLPLDPAYPPDRLAFMVEDSACPVIVFQSHLRHVVPANDVCLVALDGLQEAPAGRGDDAEAVRAISNDLAYVIYTSGSTGRPKGVQIPHHALVNLLTAMSQTPGMMERDVLLAVTTLSFDIAALELFLPLAVGGRVVIASREAALDSVRLIHLLDSERITMMQATPTAWRLLLEAGWRGTAGFKILCGGEAFPPDLVPILLEGGASVWNMYGPTETTVWSTVHQLRSAEMPVPIGRPIANTRLYVLDARGEPVPVGVPGELYIGGLGVASGYLNRPELTAERFVPDRFHAEAGGRLYRTGDLVRYRAEGLVEFLGRLDDQVKIRGFRVELAEIERVLAQHPAIAQAVVAVRDDAPGGKRLAAYLIPATLAVPAVGELRAFLAKLLPDHMVPSTFTTMTAFPLTPNGKVDRRRLPAPEVLAAERSATFVAPRTEIERKVAGVWRDVLRVAEVGSHDNFFDLGGHSLLVVQVHSKLRSVVEHDLSIVEMFQYPTVHTLSGRLARQQGKAPVRLGAA